MASLATQSLHLLRRTIAGVSDDELMTRAAALAFYSALSFAPLLVLLLWVAASLHVQAQHDLVETLTQLLGSRAAETVQLVIDNARRRPGIGSWAGWLSLGVTLIGASAVFAQLQRAINRIWGLRPRPGRAWLAWLLARMHAVGLLLALAFLMVISFAASALVAWVVQGDTWIWQSLESAVSLLLFGFIFAAIFKVLPDARIAWRDAMVGAIVTALLFMVGKLAFGMYLEYSDVGGAYGPAGSVVVLLVWVYFSAIIVLLGAEITAAVAIERGASIVPRAHARRLFASARAPTLHNATRDHDCGDA